MGKRLDITGQKFGRLTAVEIDELKTQQTGRTFWKTICECGNEKSVAISSLRKGNTQSCGCYRNDQMRKEKMLDLADIRFGRLKCISFSHTEKGRSFWNCECDCGNTKVIRGNDLTSGKVNSCGCYRSELFAEKRKVDLTGQKFGKLTANKIIGQKEDGNYMWECICECGNTITVPTSDLNSGNTKSCGCLLPTKSYTCMAIEKHLNEKQVDYQTEYTFKDLASDKNKRLRFDYAFFNTDGTIAFLVEYNGKQHYKKVEFFGGDNYLDTLQEHDKRKQEYCSEHGIELYYFDYK